MPAKKVEEIADLSLVLPPPPEIPPGYFQGTKEADESPAPRKNHRRSAKGIPAFPSEEVAIGFLRSLAYKPQQLTTICSLLQIPRRTGTTLATALSQMGLVSSTELTETNEIVFFLTGHGRQHLQAAVHALSKRDKEKEALPYSGLPAGPRFGPEDASLSQRILVYLLAKPRVDPRQVAPKEITQGGMATALNKPQSAFAKAVSRLEAAELLTSQSRYIAGGPRRLKAYQLTPLGESVAQDLRRRGVRA